MGSVFGPRKDGTPESMGQSVPRDWNWSTFKLLNAKRQTITDEIMISNSIISRS